MREVIDTPLGKMLAIAGDAGLAMVAFIDHLDPADAATAAEPVTTNPRQARKWLNLLRYELHAYFDGSLRMFTVPVAQRGSDMEQRAWRYLQSIPFGETRTYAQQAAAIGSVPRAVGRANGANKCCIVVPCHRVIGADGSLTGYAAGIGRKRWLIDHEQWLAQPMLFRREAARAG
jgi:O-6-methylguanine DNA methyltransferase